MRRFTILLAVVLAVFASGAVLMDVGTAGQDALLAVRCLHDDEASPTNRMRRTEAVTLARAINAAQGEAIERTKQYQPLAQLGPLPATPDGFVLRLYTDGQYYIFSLKDDRDPCRYGIFSDHHGFLYESSPTPPLIAS